MVLTQRPHCLRRITAVNRFNARTLGWTGVSLRCWSWPYREPPGTGSLLFLALAGKNKPKTTISFLGGVSLFSPGRSPRSRYLGFGFRQNSGNVLDEWVCSFQGAVRHKKNLSPYLPWVGEGSITAKTYFSRKIFSFLRIFIFLL